MASAHVTRRAVTLLFVAALAAPSLIDAGLSDTYSAFAGTTTSGASSFTARTDLRAPNGSVVAGATSTPGHLTPGGTYNIYAALTDAGSPASGIAAGGVTADASSLTAGQTAAAMPSGSYPFGGTTHNYRTAALTAAASLPSCSYPYTVTARDVAGNARTLTGKVMVDRLGSQYHLKVSGPSGGAMYLKSIASAGDVNNDGRDDVIIGREYDDANGLTNNGVAYVVFGQTSLTSIDLTTTTWASNGLGFRIVGAADGDRAGAAVDGVGDINGDGLDDLAVGAPRSDFSDRSDAGSVYVVWGKTTSTLVDLAQLNYEGGGGYRIVGSQPGNFLGASVAGAGNVLGDARPDLLMGGHGYDASTGNSGIAAVWAGEATSWTRDQAWANQAGYPANYPIVGGDWDDHLGWTVANAGDVNGDGRPDALVGADLRDFGGRPDAGAAYVVFGKTSNSAVYANSIASNGLGFEIGGAAGEDYASSAIAGAGDVNGDGKADVLVGSPRANTVNGTDAGSVSVVYGKATFTAVDLGSLGTRGYQVAGVTVADELGWGAANLGDVNGDGVPDAALGAPHADVGSANGGALYVVFGQRGSNATVNLAGLGERGYVIRGTTANATLGYSVAAGDASGDGRADVLATAPWMSNLTPTAPGESYAFVTPSSCS